MTIIELNFKCKTYLLKKNTSQYLEHIPIVIKCINRIQLIESTNADEGLSIKTVFVKLAIPSAFFYGLKNIV